MAVASPPDGVVKECMSTQSLDAAKESAADDISGESVRVYVRVRPLAEREATIGSHQALAIDTVNSTVTMRGDPPRSFAYDGVLPESASQEDVFEVVGRSVGSSCLAGYNGSVYVYGQTGAGKTHTMSGPISSVQSMQFDARRGIICRMLDYVFSEVGRRRAESDGAIYSCRCSFLEIYKEQITDLLEPNNSNLQVREDMNRGVYVERLSEPTVSSLTEAFQALWRGLQHRHVGSTHMNERSSRSHAVFTLYVEAARTHAGVTSTRVASCSLVDLAGSERQQHVGDPGSSLTQPYESLRVKEAGAINKSLSALTNVIMSLSREEKSRRRSEAGSERPGRRSGNFVHYRDSKLTFLLRDSLGGNSKTVIVANVSPSHLCVAETLSTLKFAARAKHIRCAVVRNEAFSGTVESLMQEVKALRQQLADLSCSGSFGNAAQKGLGSKLEEAAEEEPEAEDGSTLEEARRALDSKPLYSRQRVRRLEVLLAAALERERHAEQRRHRLQRLAGFLEDLDFRKSHALQKLHSEYVLQNVSQVQASAITDDTEVQALSLKIAGFGKLLGNLVQGSPQVPDAVDAEPWAAREAELLRSALGPPPDVELAAAEELAAAAEAETAAISGDEAAFIREENRLLRRQLEAHPEVQRLTSENWALRERLRAIDPAGWASTPMTPAQPPVQQEWSGQEGQDRQGSDSEATVLPDQMLPSPPSLSSESMLRAIEADDETSLRTWFYFQKMAKELQELLRSEDNFSKGLERCRESRGFDSPDRSGAKAGPSAVSPVKSPGGSMVDVNIVHELDLSTQEALRLAHGLLDGPGCARLPSLSAEATARLGAKEIDGGSHPNSPQKSQEPAYPAATGNAFGSWPPEQPVSDKERLKQALQRVTHLQGTVDLVNAAYGDAFDQFHRLREEYESRLEECQFFELQCSRLNLACHELAERLRPNGGGGRQRGSFSTTGFWQAQSMADKQKRSFSMSSLRDENFWEQRFEELSQLTGMEEEETKAMHISQSISAGNTHASFDPSAIKSQTGPSPGFTLKSAGSLVQSASLSSLRPRQQAHSSRCTATPASSELLAGSVAGGSSSSAATAASVVRRVASAPVLPPSSAQPTMMFPSANEDAKASIAVPAAATLPSASSAVSPSQPPAAVAQTAAKSSRPTQPAVMASAPLAPAAPTSSADTRHDSRSGQRSRTATQPGPPVLTLPRRLGEPSGGLSMGSYGPSGSNSARAAPSTRYRVVGGSGGSIGASTGSGSSVGRSRPTAAMVNVPSVAAAAAAAAAAASGPRQQHTGSRVTPQRAPSRGYERPRQVGQGQAATARGQAMYMPPTRHGAS